jgi:hypothetical protein
MTVRMNRSLAKSRAKDNRPTPLRRAVDARAAAALEWPTGRIRSGAGSFRRGNCPTDGHHCRSLGELQNERHHERKEQTANTKATDDKSGFVQPASAARAQHFTNERGDAIDRETFQKDHPETHEGSRIAEHEPIARERVAEAEGCCR